MGTSKKVTLIASSLILLLKEKANGMFLEAPIFMLVHHLNKVTFPFSCMYFLSIPSAETT